MKCFYGLSVVRCFLAGLLLALFVTFHVSAADPVQKAVAQDAGQVLAGEFDGYDKKEKLIWVGEDVFHYDSGLKVVGTATKLGLLSEIKIGEKVRVLAKGRGQGKIPMAIEIHRQ
jgi:hypothetical protein